MSIPSTETYSWLYTPLGSRIYEKILRCSSTPFKATKKLLHSLHPNYAALAVDKFGSYVVDACWSVADIDAKERIADELSHSKSMLESSFTGKFILKNCRIESFKRDGRQAWIEKISGVDKKKEMFKEFEDIIVATNDEGEVVITTVQDEKNAAAEDSLWTSTTYNDTMAVLGYKVSGSDTKKLQKKKSNSVNKTQGDGENLRVGEEEEAETVDISRKRSANEIDELFKIGGTSLSKKSKKSKRSQEFQPATTVTVAEKGPDIDDVLVAITATTERGLKAENKKRRKE
ncbi:Nucleolar protein 9 [Physocladia obscura]|uniref:Nucleolar protein 9 n=1 Tax=Physocladia obscura TaxID=109957 RepID=A0AAD5SQD3_9FUNG|nr:Nucleolar protein 9 [Physocladia obscura]